MGLERRFERLGKLGFVGIKVVSDVVDEVWGSEMDVVRRRALEEGFREGGGLVSLRNRLKFFV